MGWERADAPGWGGVVIGGSVVRLAVFGWGGGGGVWVGLSWAGLRWVWAELGWVDVGHLSQTWNHFRVIFAQFRFVVAFYSICFAFVD